MKPLSILVFSVCVYAKVFSQTNKPYLSDSSVSYVDENEKKQTTVHSNIDDATLQRVINEILKKLNN